MRLKKMRYMAVITLTLFMMGLFNIAGLEPVRANDYGVNISFSGIEAKILSGEVNFNVNTKVASNSAIKDEWQLRYKLEIMELPENKASVGQVVYYGNSSLKINVAGTIFKPQANFSLTELKSSSGVTTKFKTNLSQGDYFIRLSLIRVNEDKEIELLSESTKTIKVSDVMYVTKGFNEEMAPGEIPFSITCRVGESVSDTVYLRHKATILRNNLPLVEQSLQYETGTAWSSFKTNQAGIAYFGPEEGFTLAQLPELKGAQGITTKLKTNLSIGEYRIKLELVGLEINGETTIGDPMEISFNVQRYPTLTGKFPAPETTGLTNDNLFPQTIDGVTRYFIRLTYKLDGDLRLTNNAFNLMRSSTVHSAGGSLANIIDIDFLNLAENTEGYASRYILVKEDQAVNLYIPVKPLRPQTSYQVRINENIIYYYGGNDLDGSGNQAETWSFGTMAVPTVTSVSLGSVGEDYDVYEPITLAGDYFETDNISVKFNDTYAYRVNVRSSEGKSYLEVYLPRGRDRLSPGVYNITVIKNNNEKYSQTLYGSFSVVKASSLPVPQDGVRVKTDNRVGDVVQSVKTSSDTLLLKSSSSNQGYVYLDLDKLMGENVLARKIKLPDNGRSITTLNTVSRWANISVYNLRPDTFSDGADELEIRLGRVEPTLIPTLKRGMINSAVKSDFIEVGGENITFDKIDVEIPYANSDGQRIRVLRYDETYRQWFEQPFNKDLLNAKVYFSAEQGGVFVVAE